MNVAKPKELATAALRKLTQTPKFRQPVKLTPPRVPTMPNKGVPVPKLKTSAADPFLSYLHEKHSRRDEGTPDFAVTVALRAKLAYDEQAFTEKKVDCDTADRRSRMERLRKALKKRGTPEHAYAGVEVGNDVDPELAKTSSLLDLTLWAITSGDTDAAIEKVAGAGGGILKALWSGAKSSFTRPVKSLKILGGGFKAPKPTGIPGGVKVTPVGPRTHFGKRYAEAAKRGNEKAYVANQIGRLAAPTAAAASVYGGGKFLFGDDKD